MTLFSIQSKLMKHTLLKPTITKATKILSEKQPINLSAFYRSSISLGRLFSNKKNENEQETTTATTTTTTEEYLSSLGYDDIHVQNGMKDAFKTAFGNDITVSHLKSLGNEGLSALSKSVIDQLQQKQTNNFIGTVHVKVPHHHFEFDLPIPENENFMTVALEGSGRELLHEYLECACGGNMSCATCHIILDEESYSKLDPPGEAECDMLDLAYEPTNTSRLGCQVHMKKELDGMTITIPSGVNNFWS